MKPAIVLALVLAGSGVSAQEKAEPQSAADLPALLKELIEVMSKNGIEFETEAMKSGVLEAAVQGLDPQGYLVAGERYVALECLSSGSVFTPGIQVSRLEGRYRVTQLLNDGPAAEAGVEVKDYLLGIDGESVDNLSVSQVMSKLRGHDETSVKVRVRKTNGLQKDIEVARKKLDLPAIFSSELLSSTLCYLRLNGLYEKSGEEVGKVIKGWIGENRFGLVLDLRGASGVDVQGVVDVVSQFT
ncbi:MAG: PDZ domain-containing protein, partial [Verrucomicrobiota bacterium]